jgi:hypothetical protein
MLIFSIRAAKFFKIRLPVSIGNQNFSHNTRSYPQKKGDYVKDV